jgi:hypothetical protein
MEALHRRMQSITASGASGLLRESQIFVLKDITLSRTTGILPAIL